MSTARAGLGAGLLLALALLFETPARSGAAFVLLEPEAFKPLYHDVKINATGPTDQGLVAVTTLNTPSPHDLNSITLASNAFFVVNMTNSPAANDLPVFRVFHSSVNLNPQTILLRITSHNTNQSLSHRISTNQTLESSRSR